MLKVLECKDYTVSGETFSLLLEKETEMLVTSPQPKLEELPKYYESEAYISHTDASKTFVDNIYQLVKSYALKQKLKLINSFETQEKNLLDIGCGTGDFLITAKKNNWSITGIEPSTTAKNLFYKKLENSKFSKKVLKSDITELLQDQNKFDVITMWHVLEHVPNLENYIIQLKTLLKPNGVLVVAVPNYKSYDATYYGKYWAAYDVPRHLWHFSKTSISKLFEKVNLNVVKIVPMKFDAYYVSLLSEKYKTGKSNLLKAMYRGFLSNLKANASKEYSSLIYILK